MYSYIFSKYIPTYTYKFEKLYAPTHIHVECITSSDIKTERVDYGV